MKNFMLFCFLYLNSLGIPPMAAQGLQNQYTTSDTFDGEPFLTAFMDGDQLYLTIPEKLLDRTMLFVCYDTMRRSYMQVVWSLHRNKILLKQQGITSTAGINLPFVERLPLKENILAILPMAKQYGDSAGHTVNITDLILRQDIEWPQMFGVSIGSSIPNMSLVLGTNNGAGEVLIKVRRGMIKSKSKVAVPLFYGFCALDKPMKGRRFDYRMGFFNEEQDAGFHFDLRNSPANIIRWRLEKKFKEQKLSGPVKPISFGISPEVPKKWRPYIKAGIEEWLPAFESAGFKDALAVREVDSMDEWQAHSIHSNMIYWSQKKYTRGMEHEDFGATIGYIIDERSGEILRGDIFMGSSVQTVSEKYFIRAAPLDERAQRFPFPDELVGALYQRIAAHEAGHIFGILDGNFGEYAYPWDKMNDSLWLRTMGHTPSVMNYTRANSISQPDDSIPPSLLLQGVGPTDRYNIQWAYTEFSPGTVPEVEQAQLEKMVRWQDSVPWYRFNISQLEVVGPAYTDEVVETNNPVRSTELALKNVKRVIELLPKATQDQNDSALLERLYDRTVELWDNHMKHVLSLIGGYDVHYQSLDQPGSPYEPIPWDVQMEALDYLLGHALDAPKWLTDPEFHARTKYSTFPDKVLQYQQYLVMDLIVANRLKRLEQLEIRLGQKRLVQTYLVELQSGLFRELKEGFGRMDRRRQEIQMTYIDGLIGHLEKKRTGFNPDEKFLAHTDYSKGLMMQLLIDLKKEIEKGLRRHKGIANIGHWKLCLKKIDGFLGKP